MHLVAETIHHILLECVAIVQRPFEFWKKPLLGFFVKCVGALNSHVWNISMITARVDKMLGAAGEREEV